MKTKDKISLIAIGLFACLIVNFSLSIGLFFGIENFLEDLLVSEKPISPEIIIAAIDDESLERIGQWPWPRGIFARALSIMNNDSPAAVGIDVVFPDASRVGSADDRELSAALNSLSYPVVMPVEASPLILKSDGSAVADDLISPLPDFSGAGSVTLGHVNLIMDADGVVRKFPEKVGDFSSFSSEIAQKSGLSEKSGQDSGITRIVYSGAPGTIRRIPFWRILEDPTVDLTGKIVLIGATSPDLHDEKLTPMSRGAEMPGVEIQANMVNMLLKNYSIAPVSRNIIFFWILLASLVPISFLIFSKKIITAISGIASFLFINLVILMILFEYGMQANLFHIMAAVILATGSGFLYRHEIAEKDRREIKNLFSKYVSGDVLSEILKDPGSVSLGGEEKEITVFFSDIRGFTSLSEKTAPKEIVRILNRYFTIMTDEVLKNGGVLDKYIGDAIMAFWGAPIGNPDQADDALKASIGMVEELKKLNEELRTSGDQEIRIGIGLYTGPAIVGNIGSHLRFDYTAIGDTVNIASRLEGLNKEYATSIIIGETTKNRLKGDYRFRFLGAVAVKGRKEPLNIYTVLL